LKLLEFLCPVFQVDLTTQEQDEFPCHQLKLFRLNQNCMEATGKAEYSFSELVQIYCQPNMARLWDSRAGNTEDSVGLTVSKNVRVPSVFGLQNSMTFPGFSKDFYVRFPAPF
jgi:hypothetical protein